MITALIVIGVVAFLAIQGYVIYWAISSRRSAGDYGSVPVPGETTVTVPAGKLKLSYQESRMARRRGDTIQFEPHPDLQLEVTSATGKTLEFKGPGFGGRGSSVSVGRGRSRALVGTAKLPAGDTLTITVGPELENAVEPQILIGK